MPAQSMLEVVGENPCVILYDEAGALSAATSYWRCHHSIKGAGDVLVAWFSPLPEVPPHLHGPTIFANNEPLGRYVTDTFNQFFVDFQDRGLEAARVTAAQFVYAADTASPSSLQCKASGATIDLHWSDYGEGQMGRSIQHGFGSDRSRSYEVSSVIVPAHTARIAVNGHPVSGRPKPNYGALPLSAFLAFAETWTYQHGSQQ